MKINGKVTTILVMNTMTVLRLSWIPFLPRFHYKEIWGRTQLKMHLSPTNITKGNQIGWPDWSRIWRMGRQVDCPQKLFSKEKKVKRFILSNMTPTHMIAIIWKLSMIDPKLDSNKKDKWLLSSMKYLRPDIKLLGCLARLHSPKSSRWLISRTTKTTVLKLYRIVKMITLRIFSINQLMK